MGAPRSRRLRWANISSTESSRATSDKYPWCKPGFVPFKLTDRMAHDLLWEYAQRRRHQDAAFAEDLETALLAVGFQPPVEDTAGRVLADRLRGFWRAFDAARQRWQQLTMRRR